MVDYAGECPESADYLLWRRTGTKWPNLAYLAEIWPELYKYSAVAVLDDDLEISGESLNRAFELFQEHGLWLAQPSLQLGSFFSWSFTLQRPYLSLRFSGFVENNATMLRTQDLPGLLALFSETLSGYGLDWILPQILQAPPRTVAVIDEISVFHPARRPALDQLWSRAEQRRQGLDLCRRYQARPLEPSEHGFVLNARGQTWVAQGATPELVYATAHRFVRHQMASVIDTFGTTPGIES